MSNPRTTSASRRQEVGGRRILALFCFLGGIVLLIVGVSSLGASFFMRGEPLPDGFAWKPPLDLVSNRDLTPATVLLPLTGMPGADALNAALDSGHWENALALIAYDPTLNDPTRIGALLQLGTRYAAAKNKSQAAWCYLAATRIATTSPLVSDAVRADTFLQVSAGLRSLGATAAARLATDQAFLVAQYSPSLRRESQSRRLTLVANAYSALGLEALANQARALAAESTPVATDEAGYLPREPYVLKIDAAPLPSDVKNAAQTRMAAAKQLQDDIATIAPNRAASWPQDSIGQLRDALVQEDAARSAFYPRQIAATKEPALKIALWQDEASWLAVKSRIARGAFGASLVPDWTSNAAAIAEDWRSASGELYSLYESQAAGIPNAQAVSQAMEDVKREELLAARWGWFDAGTDDLHADLRDLTEQLRQASVSSLRLDALTVGGKTTDFLLPDDLYGKNDQALPR